LKIGTGKYKGKLPLKCFACGRIGHFGFKCPYSKCSDSDDDSNHKNNKNYQNYKKRNNGKFSNKKILYSKGDINSFDDDSDSDNDLEKVPFMEIDTKEIHDKNEGSEEEEEVDLEGELISALEELEKERKKNKPLKKELSKIKESTQDSTNSEETKKAFMDLKVKLE